MLLKKNFPKVVSGVLKIFSFKRQLKIMEESSSIKQIMVAGDNRSNQIRKANKLNVSIISEDDFMNLIQ
jgi:NAD-dependent DNA ligase